MGIFKSVPDGFYSVFSSSLTLLYQDALEDLYDLDRHNTLLLRSTAEECVNCCISKFKETNQCASTPYDILSFLEKRGWLHVQYDAKAGQDIFSFSRYAIDFFQFQINSNTNNDVNTKHMTTLYELINDMINVQNAPAARYPYRAGLIAIKKELHAAYDEIRNIATELKNNKLSIKYIRNRSDMNSALSNYLDDLRNGYLANMYGTLTITTSLLKIFNELFDKLDEPIFKEYVIADMNEYYNSMKSKQELYDELYDAVEILKHYIQVDIPNARQQVEQLKNDNIAEMTAKMHLLNAGSASSLGIIQNISELLNNYATSEHAEKFLEILSPLFNFDDIRNIDAGELYHRPEPISETNSEPIEEIDTDSIETHYDEEAYLIAKEYANEFLAGKDRIDVSDIPYSDENMEKLRFIISFADAFGTEYILQIIDDKKIRMGDYLVDHFEVRRCYDS